MATSEQVKHYATLTAEAIGGALEDLAAELADIVCRVAPVAVSFDVLAGAVSTGCECHECRTDGGRPADLLDGRPIEVRPFPRAVPALMVWDR